MKIEVLYPEFGNLFGDSSNITYLKKCIPEAKVIETEINSTPAFVSEKIDFIYLGPTTEKAQEIIIQKLKPYKEKIEELIENGTVFLFTGNAIEILGDCIKNEDGSQIEALGIFHLRAKRDMMHRKNSNIIGKYEDIEIVGFKSQFTQAYGDVEEDSFMELELGMGMNENTNREGIKKNNFIGTYVIGPILVLNPLFTKKIMKMMGIENQSLAFEKEVMEAYEARLKEFHEKFKAEEIKTETIVSSK